MLVDELVTFFVRFQNLGEMMTLGRNDAAISPSFIEGLTLDGPIGHAGKVIHAPFHTCGWPGLVSIWFWLWFNFDGSYVCPCSKETGIFDQIANRWAPAQSGDQLAHKVCHRFSCSSAEQCDQSPFGFLIRTHTCSTYSLKGKWGGRDWLLNPSDAWYSRVDTWWKIFYA